MNRLLGYLTRSKLAFWATFALVLCQLSVPMFAPPLVDLQVRALHVLFGLTAVVCLYPFRKGAGSENRMSLWDWLLIGIIAAATINIFLDWLHIYTRPGDGAKHDWVLGALLILIVLELGRRAIGLSIPLICIAGFVLVFIGPWLPGMWRGPSLPLDFVIESVYYSPLGIFGTITGFSATFIGVLIIFGSLLGATGVGETFMDLAKLLGGRHVGGAAKIAVISSAMFGTISGSSIANVSITGQYTIPLMKRLGYNPNFAGGVEAIASTGGTITPPIMGIGAFIMAEFLGIPYTRIIVYALIPCLLYYIAIFAGVHYESKRLGLAPIAKEELPQWRSAVSPSKLVSLLVPMAILIWLIVEGFSLLFASFYATMVLLALYIFSPLSLSGIRKRLSQLPSVLSQGGQQLARIIPIMVTVGMLVNLLAISGVAPKFTSLIMGFGEEYLIAALLLGGAIALLLGAPLPATATYLLCYALVVPAFIALGVDIAAANLFFFYWAGIWNAITPPTCVTCVIAAGIAKGNWLKVAFVAMKLGLVAMLMPFLFVIDPSLVARGPVDQMLLGFSTAVAGTLLLSRSLFGTNWRGMEGIFAGVLYAASGLLLLYPAWETDLWGILPVTFAFIGGFFVKKLKKVPPEV